MPRGIAESKQKRTRKTLAATLVRAGMTPPEQRMAIEDEGMANAMVRAGRRYRNSKLRGTKKIIAQRLQALAHEHGMSVGEVVALVRKRK
ncbi:MAG TPA: hypothetical protein VNM40_02470 [Candidatus Paceibacterota bacterium]|nr:hypothetical protein [Candidatus Paceibacterota bacterium]